MSAEGSRHNNNQPIVNVVGDLVAIGPIRRELVPLYQRWMNSFETLRSLAIAPGPMTLEAETTWYETMTASPSIIMFTIYERSSSNPIGNVSLSGIDYRNGSAEFGIAIGEKSARGKGYGTEATQLTLDYAFTALGLNNILLTVYEFNLAAKRVYEKAGFRVMGRRRKSKFMGGQYWDEIYMDCVADEFVSPVLATIFTPDIPNGQRLSPDRQLSG